jgi:glutaredoxin
MWSWLRSWWHRRSKNRLRHWDVVMYTRRGCHLCEEAWEQLEQAQRQHGFALRQVAVDQDPELVSRYGSTVPVVMINGLVRFRGMINPVLFKRLLRGG